MATLPLGGRFYLSDSLPISAQECVNFYLNRPQTESPTQENLFITPGFKTGTTAGTNVINRGGHDFQGVPYFVNGTDLYRVDRSTDAFGVDTYSSTRVNGGTSLPGTGRVMMADNGKEGGQICIVLPEGSNKFNAYTYTTGGGLVQISDNDFDGPVSSVRYVDGYFMFTKKTSQKFFVSNLRNGTAYTATDFDLAETDPDSVVSSYILNNEPILFGTETFEAVQNIGGAGFPFQRVEGSFQGKGLDSKFALAEVNDILFFLGSGPRETPSIWMTDGGKPQKVSTIAIDNEISTYSDTIISTCFSFQYSQAGAQFVGFTFPSERTFVYDAVTGEWATRESVNQGVSVPYRLCSIVEAYGVFLVGDCISNKIGILDKDTFTEYGTDIRRKFVTPQMDNEGDPFWIDALEIWGDAGIGLTDGTTPDVQMSFSRDGGRTFSNSISRTMGKIGEYENRTIWNSLGRFGRQICFQFQVSAAVKWVFSKVEARLE